MKAFRVANWAKNFENNRTREMKAMQWVPVPNNHDGEGFANLIEQPDGVALYGAWQLILQVASKCDPRGMLIKDGRPYSASSIAIKTRCRNEKIIARALEILVRPEIGWLESVEISDAGNPQAPATLPQAPATLPQVVAEASAGGCVEGRKEEKEGMNAPNDTNRSVPVLIFPDHAAKKWIGITDGDIDAWKQAYPACEVVTELRQALLWAEANSKKRKKNWRRFLTNWIARSQEAGGSKFPKKNSGPGEEGRMAQPANYAMAAE